MDSLHNDLSTIMIISCWIILKIRNVSNISCRVHQNTRFIFNNFLSENFARIEIMSCCFVWVWKLVVDIAGGNEAEGVWEHGVEENIWT